MRAIEPLIPKMYWAMRTNKPINSGTPHWLIEAVPWHSAGTKEKACVAWGDAATRSTARASRGRSGERFISLSVVLLDLFGRHANVLLDFGRIG